jgi:hypothetical protein
MCLIVRYLYSYLTLCKVRDYLFEIIILNKLDYVVRANYNLKSTDPCYTTQLQLLDFRRQGSTPDLQRQQKGRVSTKMSSDSETVNALVDTPRLSKQLTVGLTMGYKFCTISFKDRIGLGSGSITSHF